VRLGRASRLKRRRSRHLHNAASVLGVLDAADVKCSWTNASAGPPTIRTAHGTLVFQDDGTIRWDSYARDFRVVRS
jgi:hypothetical protein